MRQMHTLRCGTSLAGGENENVAVMVLYLHMIEMTDGIEVLLSECCPGPAIPLLRSSFEALISIEYILEENYVQRSLSWVADYAHNRISGWKRLDPTSPQGIQFLESIEADIHLNSEFMKRPEAGQKEVQGAVENLENLLRKPYFEFIEEEIGAYRKNRHRRPSWYQLFGGPENLRGLARCVGRHAQYDFLYREWSDVTHAHDLSRFTDSRLRSPAPLKDAAVFASGFLLSASGSLLKKFRPGEVMAVWYKREVQERFLTLIEM